MDAPITSGLNNTNSSAQAHSLPNTQIQANQLAVPRRREDVVASVAQRRSIHQITAQLVDGLERQKQVIREFIKNENHKGLENFLSEQGSSLSKNLINGALWYAADNDSWGCVEILLDHGGDLNLQDKNGTTLLILAAENGDDNLFEILLQFRADPSIADKRGHTPLVIAAYNGHLAIVEKLLGQLNAKSSTASNTFQVEINNALFMAAYNRNPDIVQTLIKAGGDPLVQYTDNSKEITHSVPFEMARVCLPFMVNNHDFSADASVFTIAIQRQCIGSVKHCLTAVLQEANVGEVLQEAFSQAVDTQNLELIQFLLNTDRITSDTKHEELCYAAGKQMIEVVKCLLNAGAELNGVFPSSQQSYSVINALLPEPSDTAYLDYGDKLVALLDLFCQSGALVNLSYCDRVLNDITSAIEDLLKDDASYQLSLNNVESYRMLDVLARLYWYKNDWMKNGKRVYTTETIAELTRIVDLNRVLPGFTEKLTQAYQKFEREMIRKIHPTSSKIFQALSKRETGFQ